jgi:hypothetical protein
VICVFRLRKGCNGLFDGQGIFDAEYAASAALEAVEVGSAAEGFAQVTGECADIGPFAAGHPDFSARQSQCGIVSDIYPA